MKNWGIPHYVAVIACLTALIQLASASTLDLLSSYDIIGSLQEQVNVERLNVIDVDNSGIPEILVVTSGKPGTPNTELKNSVYVFNATGGLRWRHKVDREIYASIVKDMNNDLNTETLVSFGLMQENIPRGTIQILDKNGEVIRQFSRTSLIKAAYVDDVNNDRYYELLTGSEGKLTLLYIDGEKIWEYPAENSGLLNSTVYSISTLDLDGDKLKEIMYGTSGVYLLSVSGNPICGYEVDEELDPLKRHVTYLSQAKLGADERPNIVAATSTNKIYALNVENLLSVPRTDDKKYYTAELKQKWVYGFYNNINAIRLIDLDKDGYDEILVVNEDGNIYALDNTGRLLWTFRLDRAGKDFDIIDVEKDGQMDIIVASSTSIYSLDFKGSFVWKQETNLSLEKVSVGDVDGDGMNELAVVTEPPRLYTFKLNQSFIYKTQADNYYATGERLFISSSYPEAKDYLLKARDLYTKIGDNFEVRKAQSLIDRVDYKLSDETRQMANTYYDKAKDYYISGEYDKAKKYVLMAREIYSEFGDTENILKCELLEMRINTIAVETTLFVPSTTVAKNQTTEEPADFNPSKIMLVGIILILTIAIILYLKSRRGEQQNFPAQNIPSENSMEPKGGV